MAEAFPNPGFESGSGESSKDKKSERRASVPLPRLEKIEKSAGDTPLRFSEDLLRPKPLNIENAKEPEKQPAGSDAETPKRPEIDEIPPQPQATEQDADKWHRTSAEELQGQAAREQMARLEAVQQAQEPSAEKSDDKKAKAEDKSTKSKPGNAEEPTPTRADEVLPPEAPETTDQEHTADQVDSASPDVEAPDMFEDIMRQNVPELAEPTSGGTLTEAYAEPPVDEVLSAGAQELAGEGQASGAADVEAAFQKITEQPELADLAAMELPETPSIAEAAGNNEQPASDDETFREMIRNETGEDPGEATLHDTEPGLPPVGTGNVPPLPPVPPTAEGGAWGDNDPNNWHGPWERPAGGLTDPATLAALGAVEARQELNSLKHTAREAGLAGAVGILGLGLVVEHFLAKRRDKKLKRQLNKQNKTLRQTSETLRREQYAHQATSEKLDHLSNAHKTTSEQLRQVAQVAARPVPERPLAGAEKAAGVGLISAAAAAELAANAGKKSEVPSLSNQQELANQLETNRELGRAIKRNPELRGATELTGENSKQGNHELQEVVGASAYANVLQEKHYEQLQREHADKVRRVRTSTAGSVGAPSLPSLPAPQQQPVGILPPGEVPLELPQGKSALQSKLTSPLAWATVVFIVAVVLVIVFAG